MEDKFQESIEEAKNHILKIKDSAHDGMHIRGVVNFALKIAKEIPEVDPQIIEVSGWWHDVGRLFGEAHEKISAKMAYECLSKKGVPELICQKVYDTIIFHAYSMSPNTIEGEIIRDADKLDFLSIEKWKYCIKDKNIYALSDIARLLPRLRNEFLHLEVSKKIYDSLINDFIKFVKSIEDPDFQEIKNNILSYWAELK